MINISRPFRPLAVLAILLFAAALYLSDQRQASNSFKRPNMTVLSARLQPLFEKTKTVCFGRFVVEIPATATVVFGPSSVGLPIEYYPGESEKLEQHVAAQLAEVEKDRDFLREGSEFIGENSFFGKVIDGVMPGQKLVFGSKDHVFYSIDSFIPIGKDMFVQRAITAVSKSEAIKVLNDVASHLRLRTENEAPTEPGTCIHGGFVAWQPEFERASLGVRLREFPDVHFSIEAIKNQNYLVESSALEPRLNSAEKDGGRWYSNIKFFRRGPRDLGKWRGFEALARKPSQENSTESHQFAFVSLGALHDPLQPSLDIQLDTGVKDERTASVKPSLTDEEAIALWDKLTSSIHVRPTRAEAKQNSAMQPKLPLGEFIDTGSICPQAGWWQCSDGGEIAGGRRRHLAAGDLVPHAFVLGKPSRWQILKGERPTHKIATIWKLVEYDPEPTVANPLCSTERTPENGIAQMTPSDQSEKKDAAPPRDA